jgi:hypothetical protein
LYFYKNRHNIKNRIEKQDPKRCFFTTLKLRDYEMVSMTTLLDTTKIETRLFINNEFVDSVSGKVFDTIDPATEQVICSVQEAGAADVDKAVSMSTCVCELNPSNRCLEAFSYHTTAAV